MTATKSAGSTGRDFSSLWKTKLNAMQISAPNNPYVAGIVMKDTSYSTLLDNVNTLVIFNSKHGLYYTSEVCSFLERLRHEI